MKKIISRSITLAIFSLLISSIPAFAQSEKVSVRTTPKPNTTSHLKMTQEIDMDVAVEADSSATAPAPSPMKMQMKFSFGMTMKSGAADKQGYIQSMITYDDASAEMMMNGAPTPLGDATGNLVGKSFTVVHDGKGNVIDVKTTVDLPMPAESLSEMIRSMLGNLPTEPLSVGESATMPLKMTLPMPIPGAAPISLEGSTKSKLIAVDKDGRDRIAKFDQTTEAKLVSSVNLPAPSGEQIKMDLDFRMLGDGTSQVNVDQGVLKSAESKTKLEGKVSLPSPMPGFLLKGTIRVSVTGSN